MKRVVAVLCMLAVASPNLLAREPVKPRQTSFKIKDFTPDQMACAASKSSNCLYDPEIRLQLKHYAEMREAFQNICMSAVGKSSLTERDCVLPEFVSATDPKRDSAAVTKKASATFDKVWRFYETKASNSEKASIDAQMARWMIARSLMEYQQVATLIISELSRTPFSIDGQPLGHLDATVVECSTRVDCGYREESSRALAAYERLVDATNELCSASKQPVEGRESWCSVSNAPTVRNNDTRMMYVFQTAMSAFNFENGLCGAFGRRCERVELIAERERGVSEAAKAYAVAYDVMASRRGDIDGKRLPFVSFIDPNSTELPSFSKNHLECMERGSCFGLMARVKANLITLADQAREVCTSAVEAGGAITKSCTEEAGLTEEGVARNFALAVSASVESERLVRSGELSSAALEEIVRANASLIRAVEEARLLGLSVAQGNDSLRMIPARDFK